MSSTSSSTSRLNQTRSITYDVFLSFRGEDTRYTFTDHLYKALVRAGLRTFRDDDEIERGQELRPEIENAIIESKSSIVVLSRDYANSSWCLNELWLIMKQREECSHLVVPIFYHVDPSHVRHQNESYDMKGSKGTEDDVIRWKDALTKVASLKGDVLHLSGQTYETDFIDKVVKTVNCQLDLKHVISTPAQLIGMETRMNDINSLLKNEQYNVIAIYGMGGIGKTTLAQQIFNSNKHDFKSNSFVDKIGENYKNGSLIRLQKKLLKDISGNKKVKISNALEGTSKITEVLQRKKVFIVLDDIDDQEQLNTLLGTKVFHEECKIIITTRLRHIDAWFVFSSKSCGCKVYELNSLNNKESLELFNWHAFPSKILMKGFQELAKQLTQYCGGNPLALRVLGSSLLFSDEDPSKRKDIIKIWRDRMNSLNSSKGDLDSQTQEVLRKSFDSLPLASHKDLFLHIACFFVGECEKHVISILQDDLYAKSGIMILINRCLLTISHSGHIVMHQLLQEMGRKIVCEENKDPAKRSRVWNDDESYHVMEKGIGSDTIEGLSLDIQKVKQKDNETTALQTSSLAKMDRLKLLRLKYVTLDGPYENFPKLRWLCWHGFPLESMRPGLFPSSLVAIDMSYGYMETFEVPTVLNSVKILNLKECYKLVSINNLYQFPKLEELLLSHCWSLTYLCKSVGDLESLSLLDLNSCSRLKSLPCIPSALEELCVDWCYSVENITFQSGRFSLQRFSYRGCSQLSEVQGLFKLVPTANVDEADLVQNMQWIKTYEHHKVDLVGDEIANRRFLRTQVLYEYGIMSTYLQGIEDKISMPTYEYASSSSVLSFHVPLCHEKSRIQGLNVSCLYRSSRSRNNDTWGLLAKISNTTKGLTWIYNPVVYCNPRVNEDVVWLSYWPIGNILDVGDQVHVDIIVDQGVMIVSGCGASIVYMNGELEKEENSESSTMKVEDVIGGDLSEFEVTTGGYYLCRRDLFGLETSTRLKRLFVDNIDYPESKGWKKTRQLRTRTTLNRKIEVGVRFNGQKTRILKAISSLAGIESISVAEKIGRLTLTGVVDPIAVIKIVGKFDIMAKILNVGPSKR